MSINIHYTDADNSEHMQLLFTWNEYQNIINNIVKNNGLDYFENALSAGMQINEENCKNFQKEYQILYRYIPSTKEQVRERVLFLGNILDNYNKRAYRNVYIG